MDAPRYCPRCGAPNWLDAAFCYHCGNRLPAGPEAKALHKQKGRRAVKFFAGAGLSLLALVLVAVLLVVLLPGRPKEDPPPSKYTLPDSGRGKSEKIIFRQTINPSDRPTVVKADEFSIEIPAGTVQENEELTLAEVKGLAPPIMELEPLCPPTDVKISGHTTFEDPLVIELPYDKAKVKDADLQSAFLALYYDEEIGYWVDVPFELDEERSTIRLIMHHLTIVQVYYKYFKGQDIYDTGRIKVFYSMKKPVFLKAYEVYANSFGAGRDDRLAPILVQDVAEKALIILEAYEKAKLPMPKTVSIHLTEEKNELSTAWGDISLGVDFVSLDHPDRILMRNLGHELFHSAQRASLGTVDYASTRYRKSSFWMEATADYMGNTGVFELIGSSPANKYEYYQLNFFKKSLFTMDGSHEYNAANFVHFCQKQKKAHPVQLVNLAYRDSFYLAFKDVYRLEGDSYSVLKDGFLDDYYDEFVKYSLFNNDSFLISSNNSALYQELGKMGQRTDLAFSLDEGGYGLPPPKEGQISLNFGGEFTADFHAFSTNCPTRLTLNPGGSINVYRLKHTNNTRKFDVWEIFLAEEAASIDFGKDEFILLMASNGITSTIKKTTVRYKADPHEPPPEETTTTTPSSTRTTTTSSQSKTTKTTSPSTTKTTATTPRPTTAPTTTRTTSRQTSYDYDAALAAWTADQAAGYPQTDYLPSGAVDTHTFEWVVKPYIKNDLVHWATKTTTTRLWPDGTTQVLYVFHNGEAGNPMTFSKEALKEMYPQFWR